MQFTTVIIAFVALATSIFASPILEEREIKYCGSQPYDPTKYTCFQGQYLCPIQGGVVYQNCGIACYNPAEYACKNGQLTPVTTCNGQVFDKNSYVCINNQQLCPTTHPNLCGKACYKTSEYKCVNGVLQQV
ncbi:carbohydrate binding-domain-containing protein [Morchella snyderi]|nr:carbohydrate binding-domain-containing protein [Morchella snyderi]